MKYVFYTAIGFIVLFFVITLVLTDDSDMLTSSFEWITRFILPWVGLYWFIRLVKRLEKGAG